MTMENMGELPAEQQIGETSVPPASQPEEDYVNPTELSPVSLSRAEPLSVSVASMIDNSEFRSQMHGDITYQTLNGRMSPSYSPTNNSYATLTPLQPLPPISTVSDKFSHVPTSNVSGTFTLMPQNNGLTMDMNSYRYDKLSTMGMNMTPTLGAAPMSMVSTNLSNGYQQGLGAYTYSQNGLHSPKSEHKMMSPNSYDTYPRSLAPPPSTRLHSPINPMLSNTLNGLHPATIESSVHENGRERQSSSVESQKNNQELEEINTKELAQRISSELKRYSIPQAVFAQRVLCRSQGTLSDLLRNPKPWSKLKSGRETFRRMWKWLQEPEFQRMSALRLAGNILEERETAGQQNTVKNTDSFPIHTKDLRNSKNFDNSQHVNLNQKSTLAFMDRKDPRDQMANTEDLSDESMMGIRRYSPYNMTACKRKDQEPQPQENRPPKKPRLVFTDIQRRTLHAIFKETKRPSKEMQATIAQQLGLEVTTVANFFMNARRRSIDKWQDDNGNNNRESVACTKKEFN